MRVKTYLNINAKEVQIIGNVEEILDNPQYILKQFGDLLEANEKYYLVRFVNDNVEMRGYWNVKDCEIVEN